MSRSESVVVTALCMVYDNDKILLQDRIKEDWKGVTFPGGHIEKKESFVKGIEREVFEDILLNTISTNNIMLLFGIIY